MEITDRDYWEKSWEFQPLPSKIESGRLPGANTDLIKIFKNSLPINPRLSIIDIGCAPGAWLHFFNESFGYKVNGIEYTDKGYEDTIKNLKLLNTPSEIIKDDFCQYEFDKKYDVVSSFGFIEHFEDPEKCIERHMRILNKGGYIILEIPNVRYINYLICKLLNESVLEKHNTSIMHLQFFRKIAAEYDLDVVYLNYVASFSPYLFPYKNNRLLMYFNFAVSLLSSVFLPKSKYYSPYILFIGKMKD